MADNQQVKTNWINGVGWNRLPNRTDLDDSNQGRDFRIPVGTPVFEENVLGPLNLIHTTITKLGRNIVGDQEIKSGIIDRFSDPVKSDDLENQTSNNQGTKRS